MLTGHDIIARIDQLQNESHISDYDMTKRTSLSSGCLSKLRRSGNLPRLDTLQKICEALEISQSEFFNMSSKARNGEFLSDYELQLIDCSRKIDKNKKDRLLAYAQGISGYIDDKQNNK